MSDNASTPASPSSDSPQRRKKKNNAATGASAASVRAFASQAIAFYFRAPVKSFFRTRVDYLAFARSINPHYTSYLTSPNESWSLRLSTPGLLAHAIRTHGFSFIPKHVLPPLLANITVGAATYTTYLQTLAYLHPPSAHATKRVDPPPQIGQAAAAGAAAGAVSSVVAAVPDALSTRFKSGDMMMTPTATPNKKGGGQGYKSVWSFSVHELKKIGLQGVMAGFGLSCVKETLGFGVFFAAFEGVKNQGYIHFVELLHRPHHSRADKNAAVKDFTGRESGWRMALAHHWALEPMFLGLAGVGASIAQQVVVHPLSRIQDIHYHHTLANSSKDHDHTKGPASSRSSKPVKRGKGPVQGNPTRSHTSHSSLHFLTQSRQAYRKTLSICSSRARKAGSWRLWLYKDFWLNTIRQVPSTAAGLVIFELVRRRFGAEVIGLPDEEVYLDQVEGVT